MHRFCSYRRMVYLLVRVTVFLLNKYFVEALPLSGVMFYFPCGLTPCLRERMGRFRCKVCLSLYVLGRANGIDMDYGDGVL